MTSSLYKKLVRSGFEKHITEAFKKTDRKDFVSSDYENLAYEDIALPIGHGQTISQPTTIAIMLTLLELGSETKNRLKILEVGCGSGYVIKLLSLILPKSEIYATDRIPELCTVSRNRNHGINLHIVYTPDTLGLPEFAPFNRILVSASADSIPIKLLEQLSDEGIMVCPVKNDLHKIKKTNKGLEKTVYSGFMFVPLIY